jgi:signal transduction histidine kinase
MTIHKKITLVFLLLSLFFLNKTASSNGEGLRNVNDFQHSYKKIKEATVFLSENRLDLALNTLKEIDSKLFANNDSLYIYYLNTLTETFLKEKKIDSAYYYANKSLEIAQKYNLLDKTVQAYNLLSTIDTTVRDYKQALENYRKTVFYRDSLFRKNYVSKIEELKLQFDVEKKDFELNLLNEQNEIVNRKTYTQRLIIILALLLIALAVISRISIYQSRKKFIRQNKEIIDQKEKITLQKEALEHKNEQLNNLVKTKDKFFSIISHDLRGPFHSLTGLLDLMLEDFNSFSDEEKYEYIQLMRSTSQNSYELLEMLLEWSRAQRGLIESTPEDTNIYSLVDSVVNLAEARAMNKSQKLLNLVKPELQVYVDQKLVKTIFNNLINNSIKFTPTGGTIEITAEDKAEEIVFCVSDNGIGMPQDKADKIFCIDSNFKRKGTSNEPGTGLGLIIVKEFINLMKGTIWAESEENFGTKIFFIIPKEV